VPLNQELPIMTLNAIFHPTADTQAIAAWPGLMLWFMRNMFSGS
jgi:hypothetical protein